MSQDSFSSKGEFNCTFLFLQYCIPILTSIFLFLSSQSLDGKRATIGVRFDVMDALGRLPIDLAREVEWDSGADNAVEMIEKRLTSGLLKESRYGNVVSIQRIIDSRANVNVKFEYENNMTPGLWACSNNHPETVQLLIDNGNQFIRSQNLILLFSK